MENAVPVVKHSRMTSKIYVRKNAGRSRRGKKEKRLDRNPASFKIQYPMKNQDKDEE